MDTSESLVLYRRIEIGNIQDYTLKDPKSRVYIFILDGDLTIENQDRHKRDGFGL